MKCHHYEDCGNEAVYDLEVGENEIIHVCCDCDKDYGICGVCGYVKPHDILSFVSEHDNQKTCYDCWGKNIEKLKKMVSNKVSSDYKIYKERALFESKESLFNNSYVNAIAGEWLSFFENNFGESYDNEVEILDWLLSLTNIFEILTNNTMRKDDITFSSEAFSDMFEWFCGIKVG